MTGKFKFQAALTDGGICHVMNGRSLKHTYNANGRIIEFQRNLDSRQDDHKPDMIHGTGKLFRKTFWLDIGERWENSELLYEINNQIFL